ncbi:zinc finger protein 569-like [Ostrinia furnacalis]|uniref:zinc finger protein 569-like n=1 Tax=Ostrinia furnacalis TaxID=93504 RepID=UPI00103E8B0D|nr:zinc finger protein 569-like [Ostrinia furnacalis]XP_028166836.1 zinc finger protein 569-like [Ostrinia furnacalis]XP_028166837.1 zinc finger protein 569-like [Ostrinia furnacalis]
MVSVKEEVDVKMKMEYDQDQSGWKVKEEFERKDPTSFLPEEPMSYEIKEKKKKKKKKKQEDPFKDIEHKQQDVFTEPSLELKLDPEVNIKVENIEVELDFNDFDNGSGLTDALPDDTQEPVVKLEQNQHALLLTFESVINEHSVLGLNKENNEVESEHEENVKIAPTYLCKVCHLVFKSTKTLRMHQKRKHKVYRRSFKHICDYCGMSYETKNSLIAHIRRKHGPDSTPEDKEERTCEICALVFKGMARLRMHMQRKHGSFVESFKHECSECGLTYDKYRSLMVHFQRKHSGAKKPIENQWYNCPFCPKIFTRRETYARHMQRKHKVSEEDAPNEATPNYLENCKNEQTGEITCKECPLVFSSIGYLKLHMRRKHNALKEYFRLKCSFCNLSYDKVESLKRHVRRKHDQGSHCEVCNKQFDTRESYLNHSHIRAIKECSLCGLIFASQGGLAKHIRCTHKIDSPKVAYCNICNEGFHDRRLLKPHLLKVHLKVSYTCKYCKKIFKAKESYRRHVLIKHFANNPLNVQKEQCDQCPEAFNGEFELCKHINLAHGKCSVVKPDVEVKTEDADMKNNYQCTKCPEIYPNFEQLKLHFEQNHTFSTETQCQMCGEMVPGSDLQKHIKSAHTETTVQCKYCEFNTTNKNSMTQHLLRHKNATTLHCEFAGCRYKSYYEGAMMKHKQKHKELGVKFQCSKCPFQSMNKYILRYHEEAHMTGKKRYTCDQCDYATILPANLVQHKYKHSTEKRFKCEVCPFATKYNTSLRFHVKKKHCDLPSFS